MRIAAIILAAGASTRLGSPKQLVRLGAETLLERSVRIAIEADCSPVVVVLGANVAQILAGCDIQDATVVINDNWNEGMSTSIQCGIEALQDEVDGAVLMACDQPAVTSAHLRALLESGRTTASAYSGRQGTPAFFQAGMFSDLRQLWGDAGARQILQIMPAIPLPLGEVDFDTVEDLQYLNTFTS